MSRVEFTIHITPETAAKFEQYAQNRKCSLDEIIQEVLQGYVEQQE